eukprot:767779-Hanusia_phi.AAC.6
MGGAVSKGRRNSTNKDVQPRLRWQPTEIEVCDGYWVGMMCNEAPGEYGSLRRSSDETYTGFFHAGKAHMLGKLAMPDGSCYIGEFKENQRHGVGTLFHGDGSFVRGSWMQDLLHGYGIFYELLSNSSGCKTTEGFWTNGEIKCAINGELDHDFIDDFLDIRRKEFVFFDEEGNHIEEPYSERSSKQNETRIQAQKIGTKALQLQSAFNDFHENLLLCLEQVMKEAKYSERLQSVWSQAKSGLLEEISDIDERVEAIVRASDDSSSNHSSLVSLGEQALEKERRAGQEQMNKALSAAKDYEEQANEKMREVRDLQAQKNAMAKALQLLETKQRNLNEALNTTLEDKTLTEQNYSKTQEDMQLSEISMKEMRRNLERQQESIKKDTEAMKKLAQDYEMFKEQLHSQSLIPGIRPDDADIDSLYESTLAAIQERKDSLTSKIQSVKAHLPQDAMGKDFLASAEKFDRWFVEYDAFDQLNELCIADSLPSTAVADVIQGTRDNSRMGSDRERES